MKRVRMKIAYDGTNYVGFEQQKNGTGIAAVLDEKLSELTGESIRIIGASRTDSGVHAMGNIIVFDTESRIPAEKFCYALNTRLPEDIRALSSEECPLSWHPRHAHGTKTYIYRILNERFEDPLRMRYCIFSYFRLDLSAMREAAACFTGEHDFRSFSNPGSQVLLKGGSPVRTLHELRVEAEREEGPYHGMITLTFRGNGFLYNMVRILAGTLLEVGTGRFSPADMPRMLAARERSAAGPTAPAKALTLVSVEYEDEKPAEKQKWS